jgi:hypothetical protein
VIQTAATRAKFVAPYSGAHHPEYLPDHAAQSIRRGAYLTITFRSAAG